MKKILILPTILLFIINTANAYATCTQPVGIYTGSLSMNVYNMTTGSVFQSFSILLQVNFAQDGSVTAVEIGKKWGSWGSGKYRTSWTVPSIGTPSHTFNTFNCRGVAKSDLGQEWVYVSTASGTKITGAYYGDDNIFYSNTFVLDKL